MDKQLLIETFTFDINKQSLNESISNGGKIILEGIIQRANSKNQNGRIYPKHVLEREIKNYINGPIREKRAFGELDHSDQSIVNLKNVCLNILDIWWDGDDVLGRMEVLDTPSGQIAKAILKAGCTLGISSRALGSVANISEGVVEVQDDLNIVCWDFVSDPSTHQAYVKEVNKNYNINENRNIEINKYSKINSIVSDIICMQTGMCCIK